MKFLLAALLLIVQDPQSSQSVRLDFPDTVELKVVVDYVATTQKLNILYDDDALTNKRVALRVTQPVGRDTLLPLLRTLLRSRGLALVNAEQDGWLKIVAGEKLASEAGPLRREFKADGDADVITFVLPVRFGDLARIQTAITPLLTKPGGTVLVAGESRALVISDYGRNVRRAVELASLLDVESAGTQIESLEIRHQEPAELAGLVTRLLAEREKVSGGTVVPGANAVSPLSLQPNPISGGLIAIGSADAIDRARALIQRFDKPVTRKTELYQPRYTTATRLRPIVEQWIGTQSGVRLATDDAGNMLIVTARSEEHARIRELLSRFDVAPPDSSSPLRFYKLMNRRADDVFATLGALLGGPAESQEPNLVGSTSRPAIGQKLQSGGGVLGGKAEPIAVANTGKRAGPISGSDPLDKESGAGRGGAASIRGENYSLSVDVHTNTIVAIAPPEMHRQLAQLIEKLDKRRPQVLVEVTLVSIAVDDSLNLGVELETLDLGDPWDYLLFTSFGLSQITPTDGHRRMTPLSGGSGALIAPDEVPIIINALAGKGNTRVYSAPRILVDDNATGRIESVAESPFTSVNASNTVATTSFAGFAKAGTQLSIEPHIAEGDHLEIKYDLSVSSFTGAATGAAPPPRSSDTMSSTVRVPDNYTVVVGGLLTETLSESSNQVPLVGDIPGLGLLFGNRSNSKSKVRLYAFIRPTILRNDGFEDLKYLSSDALRSADVPDGFPPDRLQYMR